MHYRARKPAECRPEVQGSRVSVRPAVIILGGSLHQPGEFFGFPYVNKRNRSISMQKYTQEIHKDTLAAMARLLEARLLLVECKFALIRENIRPDLVAQIDAINAGFTALRWSATRAASGKVIDVVEGGT